GGPASTTPTNGFRIPSNCELNPQVVQASFGGSASFAACPAGTRGAGGGYLENGLAANLFTGEPTFPNFGIEGFLCVHDAAALSLSAYAVCVNDPGSIGYTQVQQNVAAGNAAFVQCPAGKTVIGGGCSDDTFANDRVGTSLPITTPMFGLEGWLCIYNSNVGGSLTAHATCIDTAQASGLQVVQQNTATSSTTLASCPAGNVILGGGCVDFTVTSNLLATLPLTSPPFANDGWACAFSATTGNLTSVALCQAP
ncbi:MAG: hypothetical protein KDD47_07825, partial [Acidobacteria bacterium]|nr:hypothetical protein [Acidobacteriota bacterium]